MNKLLQAGTDKQESERDAKLKETLAILKKTFPGTSAAPLSLKPHSHRFAGVKGRVIDLCKPVQSKYDVAVTTILGRHIHSVVVDSEKTAISCIEVRIPFLSISSHPSDISPVHASATSRNSNFHPTRNDPSETDQRQVPFVRQRCSTCHRCHHARSQRRASDAACVWECTRLRYDGSC